MTSIELQEDNSKENKSNDSLRMLQINNLFYEIIMTGLMELRDYDRMQRRFSPFFINACV